MTYVAVSDVSRVSRREVPEESESSLSIADLMALVEEKRRQIGAPPSQVRWKIPESVPPIAASAHRAAAVISALLRIASDATWVEHIEVEATHDRNGVRFAVDWQSGAREIEGGSRPQIRDGGLLHVRLGLVKQVIDQVEGRLEVDWRNGCPTTIVVWLPFAR